MNICFLTKYPPIEGGVSSTAYWFAKALGERGHKVHVVTNAKEVEDSYVEKLKEEEKYLLEPKNVKVHFLEKDFKSPILKSDYFTDRLSGLAIKIVNDYNIDVIYSFYLMPYGVAGMITKFLTKKPFIVRNAGSDIGMLYKNTTLKPLLEEVLKKADWIHGAGGILKVIDEAKISREKIVKFGHGTVYPDFNPKAKPFIFNKLIGKKTEGKTILTFVGKIQKIKGVDNLVEALSIIKNKNYLMIFISGKDREVEKLKKNVQKAGIKNKCIFLDFQPPWKMPSIYCASDSIILPEDSESPMLPEGVHYPIIAREAMACGKCVMMGKGIAQRGYYKFLKSDKEVIIINPEDLKDFTNKLKQIIDKPEFRKKIGLSALRFSQKIEKPEIYYEKVSNFFSNINN